LCNQFSEPFFAISSPSSILTATVFDGNFDNIDEKFFISGLYGKTSSQIQEWVWQRLQPIPSPLPSIRMLSVCPGVESSIVNIDRQKGAVYSIQWEALLSSKYRPHWVLINTWNDWANGTEIESSQQFANEYLILTKKYIERFKASKESLTSKKDKILATS